MRIFVTHIGPKETVLKYHIPAAPVYFSYNLIEGGAFDKVYSILPANIIGEKKDFSDDKVETIYSSWRGKRFLHKFAPFVEDLVLFHKIPREAKVWFYNINMLTAFLIVLLGIFKPSVKRYTIMLDYTPGAKWNSFLLKLINRSEGIISLSNTDLFTVKNMVVLPGVVPERVACAKVEAPITRDFLLSGNLNEQISMLHLVLPAFSQMPELKLHITGFSGDKQFIQSFSEKYSNIVSYGMLEYDDYLALLHRCPFLLSTRNPAFPENKCNFPSKIIEGLVHNRIIISTIHYEQLDGINYIEVPPVMNCFVDAVREWLSRQDSELLLYANQSDIAFRRYNSREWARIIQQVETKK